MTAETKQWCIQEEPEGMSAKMWAREEKDSVELPLTNGMDREILFKQVGEQCVE